MAKITRKIAKLFGSAAGGSQMGVFGSFANGSPAYSTDPAVIQDSNWLGGWFSAILGEDNPCIEDFNSAFLVFAYQIAYMLQTGVGEWNTDTIYYIGSQAQDGFGVIYISLTDGNTGNALSDTAHWKIYDTVPVGVPLPFTGTVAPAGYLLCDGSSLSRTTFATLFAITGNAFGTVDGTHFNIPDLRGYFLRGLSGASGRDPDASSRTAMNAGGNTGNNIGSVQADQFFFHTHIQNPHMHTIGGGGRNIVSTGTPGSGAVLDANVSGGAVNYSYPNTDAETAVNQGSGGNETRPLNAYLNFIIKY